MTAALESEVVQVLDILREIAHIGAGHASTTLSTLLDKKRCNVSLPTSFSVDDAAHWMNTDAQGVAIELLIRPLRGSRWMFFLDKSSAERLAKELTAKLSPATARHTPVESTLLESGNIIGSAYLSAVARLVGETWLPSVPSWHQGRLDDIVRRTLWSPKDWVMMSRISIDDNDLWGYLVLCLSDADAKKIVDQTTAVANS